MPIIGKQERIGNRKNMRFYLIEADQYSERGFNRGVQVFLMDNSDGYLHLVADNYRMNSAAWRGYNAEAVRLLTEKYADIKTSGNGYHIDDKRVTQFQPL